LTRCALTAASAYGLSEELGLIWLGEPEPAEIRQMLAENRRLEEYVRSGLRSAYTDACSLISKHRKAVKTLALALVEQNSLSGLEAAKTIGRTDSTDNMTL